MYIRGFDGLRALAMFLVFLTHKTVWGAKGELGFSGVWVFFLLSGFLISAQLQAARQRIETRRGSLRNELGAFCVKRAMRIFPAYYILILLVVPVYLWTHRDIPGLPYYLTYLSNFYFQAQPSEFLTTWAHFWTLAVEEQYYLLFAPLMLLVPTSYASAVCTGVIIGSLFQRFGLAFVGVEPYFAYIDSILNFGILSLGGLLYLQRDAIARIATKIGLRNPGLGWFAALAIVGFSPFAGTMAGVDRVALQAWYVVGGIVAALLLMYVYLNQSSLLVRALELRPVAYFGRISYGLYLYNDYVKNDIPERILRFGAAQLWPEQGLPWVDELLRDGTTAWFVARGAGLVVCFLLLVAVAHLSWILVEKSALRFRDRLLIHFPRNPVAEQMHPGKIGVSAAR